jgi:hypothetical protein
VQLVIPMEVDQGGEDVGNWNIFPFNFFDGLSMIMFSFLVPSVCSLYLVFFEVSKMVGASYLGECCSITEGEGFCQKQGQN